MASRTIVPLSKATVGGLVSISKAAVVLGVSNRSAAIRLASLVGSGWARRVRRGLYVISPVPLESHGPFKAEDPWALAHEIFSPYYVGGWSAAEYWGLTEQLSISTLIVTAANLRSSSTTVAGHSFRLLKVARKRTEGAIPTLRDGATVLVSSPERTLIDCLRNPELSCGIGHLVAMLHAYLRRSNSDLSKLIGEAKTAANGVAWKRLGYLVEREWPKMRDIQEIAKQNLSAGYSRLDPWNEARGRLVRRWRLWVNAGSAQEAANEPL